MKKIAKLSAFYYLEIIPVKYQVVYFAARLKYKVDVYITNQILTFEENVFYSIYFIVSEVWNICNTVYNTQLLNEYIFFWSWRKMKLSYARNEVQHYLYYILITITYLFHSDDPCNRVDIPDRCPSVVGSTDSLRLDRDFKS